MLARSTRPHMRLHTACSTPRRASIWIFAFALWLGCSAESSREQTPVTPPRSLPEGVLPQGSPSTAAPRTDGVELSTARLRIVSLAPSLTRMLIELDAGRAVVGIDTFSAGLHGMAGVTVLGGLFAPDLERLVGLEPSLVVGVESSEQQALFDQLRSRGTQVETFRLHSLEQVLDAFERVGRLVGAPDRGRELAARVRRELAEVSIPVAGRARPRVALVIEREPLFVVGAGSFASALIEAAGGENVFADLSSAYPRVSLEALADRAPDVLLETTEPTADSARAARQYWSRFSFVRRVETLPRGDVVLPSPALPHAARLLRAALHPDLSKAADP